MTIRAKFRVNLVTPFTSPGHEASEFRVDMTPVYDSDPESENAKFYKATPWGQITLGTVNPAVAELAGESKLVRASSPLTGFLDD